MGCFESKAADGGALGGASGELGTGANSGADGGAAASFMTGNNLSSTVLLHISCSGLKKMDTMSKSDPFVVVYAEERQSGSSQPSWNEVGRTETIVNTQNPVFVKAVPIKFNFESVQKVRFKIYDSDDESKASKDLVLARQDFQGESDVVTLGDIVSSGSRGKTSPVKRQNGAAAGTVKIVASERREERNFVIMKLRCKKLANKDGMFNKSDPFVIISRLGLGGVGEIPIYRTSVIMNDLNPCWRDPVVLRSNALCECDENRKFRLKVLDYDADGSHDLIGQADVSVRELLNYQASGGAAGTLQLQLTDPRRGKKTGLLIFDDFRIEQRPTFLDYVMGGTKLNFMVAIDFTASNGNQNDVGSLHSMRQMPNQYATAIAGVGDVLEFYDDDKQYPVWGFGGIPPGANQALHCFSLLPAGQNANGISGVQAAYVNSLPNIRFSGPTIFSEVIQTATGVAASGMDGSEYTILLMITDGVITDMDNTIASIIQATNTPLSILIVGVGNADFSMMDRLDGDDNRLRLGNLVASRDIVQFVPLREFANRAPGMAKKTFSEELLAEIPEQLCTFMRMNGIQPQPRQVPGQVVQPVPAGGGAVKVADAVAVVLTEK